MTVGQPESYLPVVSVVPESNTASSLSTSYSSRCWEE